MSFSYLLFSVPFCYIGGDTGLAIFLGICIIFLAKYYIITIFRDKVRISWNIILVFGLFILYCVLPIGPYNSNFLYKLAFLSLILFTVWVVVNQRRVINFRFNIRILCLALLISSAFTATYFISPYLQSTIFMFKQTEHVVRFQALLGHANAFGTICSLCIAFMAYSYMKKHKWYDLALLLIISFAGIFSFSKTYLVILILVALVITIHLYRHNIRLALWLTLAMLIGIGLFIVILPDVYAIFYNRFLGTLKTCHDFRDVMNMITTDRFDLWIQYIQYLAENPVRAIFGCGLGAMPIHKFSAHNAYISMIYQLGLIGSVLLILVIVFIVRDRLIKSKINFHHSIWLPFTVIALIFFIEDIMFYIM